jgi:hypothetical protein
MIKIYETEFPREYWPSDEEVALMEHAGLEDSSWHNEACCSWSDYMKEIQLFIHPVEPKDHEYPNPFRIHILTIRDDQDTESLLSTNSLDEALAFIVKY